MWVSTKHQESSAWHATSISGAARVSIHNHGLGVTGLLAIEACARPKLPSLHFLEWGKPSSRLAEIALAEANS